MPSLHSEDINRSEKDKERQEPGRKTEKEKEVDVCFIDCYWMPIPT